MPIIKPFGIIGVPKRSGGPLVKPAPGSVIATQHQLAQGLWVAHTLQGLSVSAYMDPVQGARLVNSSIDTAATNLGVLWPVTHSGGLLTTGLRSLSKPFTLACRINRLTNTARQSIVGVAPESTQWADIGVAGTTGNAIQVENSGAGYIEHDSGFAIAAGSDYSMCNVFASNTSRSIYVNGSHKSTNTTNGTLSGCTRFGIGQAPDTSPKDDYQGLVYYAYVWFRALNPSEIAKMHAEPYCFFWEPGRRTIFLPMGSSASSIITRRRRFSRQTGFWSY